MDDSCRTGLSLCQEPQRGVAVVLQQVTAQPSPICGVQSHCELHSPRLMTFYDLLDDEEKEEEEEEDDADDGAEGESRDGAAAVMMLFLIRAGAHTV